MRKEEATDGASKGGREGGREGGRDWSEIERERGGEGESKLLGRQGERVSGWVGGRGGCFLDKTCHNLQGSERDAPRA